MRLAIVMKNFRQVLARNSQLVGKIVITRRYYQLARAVIVDSAEIIHRRDLKLSVGAGDRLHSLILGDSQMIVFGHLPVVFERFLTRRLLMRGAEGNIADLQ